MSGILGGNLARIIFLHVCACAGSLSLANFSEEVVANLPNELASGVYYGFASVSGGPVYAMVMSIGWNPTYNNEKRSMETHLLHVFSEDFYGEELRVCIVGFLREEKKFPNEEELVVAIHEDIDEAKRLTLDPANQEYKNHSFFSNN